MLIISLSFAFILHTHTHIYEYVSFTVYFQKKKKKSGFFFLFMLLSALLLIPQITTFPIWCKAYCIDTKNNYTPPSLQHRHWIASGTLCFSCPLPFSSCTLSEFSSAAWHNSEHFQGLKPLGAAGKFQWCMRLPEEQQELQVWNLFSVLVSSEKITAEHRAIFCGFKC